MQGQTTRRAATGSAAAQRDASCGLVIHQITRNVGHRYVYLNVLTITFYLLCTYTVYSEVLFSGIDVSCLWSFEIRLIIERVSIFVLQQLKWTGFRTKESGYISYFWIASVWRLWRLYSICHAVDLARLSIKWRVPWKPSSKPPILRPVQYVYTCITFSCFSSLTHHPAYS